MLHLIFQCQADSSVLDRMAGGDAAVFLANGVLGVLQRNPMADVLSAKLHHHRLYVLSEDMAIRGILPSELTPGLELVDYTGLVQLTVEHDKIVSWT